jgi:ATP-dependent Lon protease
MPTMSPEAADIRNYVETLAALPWRKSTRDRLDLQVVQAQLDADHFGLERIKERILEYLAVLKLTRSLRGPILCLTGPPGVGKTSLGRSIAAALGRKFVRVSLGGMHDEAEIRGHRRTYIGAMPGRIIQSLKRCGSNNPVFLLDEIDKLGRDFRGDPASALLEALDPEQNAHFSDHYLEVAFDLSKVFFITTANVLHTIPAALRDRLEVIQLPGYLHHEKAAIAKGFLLPKQLKAHGIAPGQVEITDAGLEAIIHRYTRESGVRNLEREIGRLCRKVARQLAGAPEPAAVPHRTPARRGSKAVAADPTRIDVADLTRYLSVAPYLEPEVPDGAEIGVATGLAWTSTGGEILPIEVTMMSGTGKLILTGQLGDVMKESARAALSYVRSIAAELGGRPTLFDKNDVHVHVPEGAIPKDGPSAGLAIATAMASLVSGVPVQRQVAMTGEITLRGRALSIGGLNEKAVAALRAGVHTLLIPHENAKDIEELPAHVRESLQVIPVRDMQEVLARALKGSYKRSRRGGRPGPSSGAANYTH